MKNYFLLIYFCTAIVFNSCKKEESTSNPGNLKIVINNGPTLTANFVDEPIANSTNTFSFQSTNRAMIFAYFNTTNDAYLDIWPLDKIGNNIIVNKKYTSNGDWTQNQDDFEFGCTVNGSNLQYDYCEITFSKYKVPGEIEATFKATKNNLVIATGNFSFVSK